MALSALLGGALGGLGSFIASPQGQAMTGNLGRTGLGFLSRYFQSPGAEQLAQQQMLQQMQQQQPFQQVDFEPIRQEAMRLFEEQTLPGIREGFTAMGGRRSSAFGHSITDARAGLASRLAALQAQHSIGEREAGMRAGGMNQQRLRDLASYLGGQQQLDLGSQQLAQRGREASMSGLGMMGQQGRGEGLLGMQRAQAPFDAATQLANLGLGQMSQTTYQPGTAGYMPAILQALAQTGREVGSAFAGRPGGR